MFCVNNVFVQYNIIYTFCLRLSLDIGESFLCICMYVCVIMYDVIVYVLKKVNGLNNLVGKVGNVCLGRMCPGGIEVSGIYGRCFIYRDGN